MARGYSINTITAIQQANKELLGVQLGRLCTDKDIPVSEIAAFTGVTRATVYSWFKGHHAVASKHIPKVTELIEKLS